MRDGGAIMLPYFVCERKYNSLSLLISCTHNNERLYLDYEKGFYAIYFYTLLVWSICPRANSR